MRCCRRFLGGDTVYKPRAIPLDELEIVELGLDELEAMRLCDVEELQQVEAAERLGVSRGTVQRLLWSGRKKLVGAIASGQAVRITSGGHILEQPAEGEACQQSDAPEGGTCEGSRERPEGQPGGCARSTIRKGS
jgi:predicted DNA-binding protein (UPF0251 family)